MPATTWSCRQSSANMPARRCAVCRVGRQSRRPWATAPRSRRINFSVCAARQARHDQAAPTCRAPLGRRGRLSRRGRFSSHCADAGSAEPVPQRGEAEGVVCDRLPAQCNQPDATSSALPSDPRCASHAIDAGDTVFTPAFILKARLRHRSPPSQFRRFHQARGARRGSRPAASGQRPQHKCAISPAYSPDLNPMENAYAKHKVGSAQGRRIPLARLWAAA